MIEATIYDPLTTEEFQEVSRILTGAGVSINLPMLFTGSSIKEAPENEEDAEKAKIRRLLNPDLDDSPTPKIEVSSTREISPTTALVVGVLRFSPISRIEVDVIYDSGNEETTLRIPLEAIKEILWHPTDPRKWIM